MTRTRTQTALTGLIQLIANTHGELEYVGGLLAETKDNSEVLFARQQVLIAHRDSL